MANNTQGGGLSFIDNLGKIYGIYTGGFAAFVIFLAILEQMGVSNRIIGYLFVFLTVGVYAMIGILSRTAEMGEYYVAGRKVPAVYNGMATGSGRSEERRVGTECVRKCRTRLPPSHYNKKQPFNQLSTTTVQTQP